MTSPLDNGSRWAVAGLAAFCIGVATWVADHSPVWALVNESPSLPRGLYLRLPDADVTRGAVVALPQPPAARRYLGRLGMPSDVLLLKRVAAERGDPVCRTRDGVTTPRGTVDVHETDRQGVRLESWSGCRVMGSDEIFLLGDSKASFDSRYFGPVRKTAITGVYRELVTW